MYAEITASQANTYLYQDIDTAHSVPTVYTVKPVTRIVTAPSTPTRRSRSSSARPVMSSRSR